MKRAVAFVALSFVLVLGMAVKIHGTPPGNDDRFDFGDLNKIRIGYKINPVPLNLKGKNVLLVGLGSYIVNGQADCAGCHSTPQYRTRRRPPSWTAREDQQGDIPLRRGRSLRTFRATQYHANSQGRPGNLTLEQFLEVFSAAPTSRRQPGDVRCRRRQQSASGHAVAGIPAHDAC